MKYFTTLEVAHQLGISKQTLLNWLYARKVPEPPRNKAGYRLWSAARVNLVKDLIWEGRLNKRTVIYRRPTSRAEVMVELARDVVHFLRDANVDLDVFVKELRHVQAHSRAVKQHAVKRRARIGRRRVRR